MKNLLLGVKLHKVSLLMNNIYFAFPVFLAFLAIRPFPALFFN